MSITLGRIVELLEERYPPALASSWDAVGLTCGDPNATVTRVLFAVDADPAVIDEALIIQADLIVTHHPLLLRGVHSVAAIGYKGSAVHTLVSHGIALYTAHTNADHASPGVSDALAARLGVRVEGPLAPDPDHPGLGVGRVGRLDQPVTLEEFSVRVAKQLPGVVQGVRVSGDPQRMIERVALCGGSGDDLLAVANTVADVYVTSDLRHHPAQEHRAAGGCALVDVAHWAGEWPWLEVAAADLAADVDALGSTVDVHVSTLSTDPWTTHRGSTP